MHLTLGGKDSPIANEHERHCLQDLDSYRRKVVRNIKSHAPEFGWVRLPLANEQEKGCLQHLESCTKVWECKTPLSNGLVYHNWSEALEFGWISLPPC